MMLVEAAPPSALPVHLPSQQIDRSRQAQIAAPFINPPQKINHALETFYDALSGLAYVFFYFFWYGWTYTAAKALEAYNNQDLVALRGMLFLGIYLDPDAEASVVKAAFESNDAKTVKLLQRVQPELTVKDMPLVFYAVHMNKLDILRGLLDSGLASIEDQHNGYTLLDMACQNKNTAFIVELVKRGADVSVLEGRRFGIVNGFILTGQYEIAKRLIEHKVDIRYMDEQGQTPLSLAFAQGNHELAHLLVKHGASYLSVNDKFPNLLLEACKKGWFDIASDMLDNIQEMRRHQPLSMQYIFDFLEPTDELGRTPAMLACIAGEEDLAVKLIEKGANLHTADESGKGLMHYACDLGLKDVFRTLVYKPGMHLAKGDGMGVTPMQILFLRGETGMVATLAAQIKQRRGRIEDGAYLFEALRSQNARLRPALFALLERGLGLDAKDRHGNTLMHEAALSGDQEVVDALLEAGASVDVLNNNGETPMQIAVRNKQFKMASYLHEKGAKIMFAVPEAEQFDNASYKAFIMAMGDKVPVDVYFCSVCARGDLELVKKAQFLGANPNVRDMSGLLPLHHAAMNGHVDVVRHLRMGLVSLNVDEARTGECETVLHLAVKAGKEEMVRYLVDEEDLLDEKDMLGNTALRLAYQTNQSGMVKLLREKGANPKKVPDNERFAIDHPVLHRMKQAISSSKPQVSSAQQPNLDNLPI
jgi:ankyrin repeat protein